MSRLLLLALCSLLPAIALAEGPTVGVAPRAVETSYALVGGSRAFGAGVVLPGGWTVEARLAPFDATGELLHGRGWTFGGRGIWAARLRADAALTVPYRGPLDVGAAGWLTATGSVGGEAFEAFAGLQAAAEAFVNPGWLRLPARALLGVRARFANVELQLAGRAGIDWVPAAPFAIRGEAWLAVAWAPR